jgi:hypothetical protein
VVTPVRELHPEPNELAVFLLPPGEDVVVHTVRGPDVRHGNDPGRTYPEVMVGFVPYDPAALGWGLVRSQEWGAGPGTARTPTGLHVTALRRYVRGHKADELQWDEVRRLLGEPARAVLVRLEWRPYFSRTRMAVTGVRLPEGVTG